MTSTGTARKWASPPGLIQRNSDDSPVSSVAVTTSRDKGPIMRILVVDDEPAFRQMLAEWLSRRGYDVATLNNEAEVLDILEPGAFDVVILDLMMPRANGLSLISRVRELRPDTNVIIISAATDVRIAIEATRAGAEACLEKPVDFELLE